MIIHAASHVDHALTPAQIAYVLASTAFWSGHALAAEVTP